MDAETDRQKPSLSVCKLGSGAHCKEKSYSSYFQSYSSFMVELLLLL